jgi:membrane dipeptidase
VKDETLLLLRQNGGVIMICFLPPLVKTTTSSATVSCVAAHIIHAGELIGYSYVGIGSDFDGMLQGPEGLEDVSCYPRLVAELLKKGVSEENIQLVMGRNIMRVLEEVENCCERMQKDDIEKIMYDDIGEVWTVEQKTMLTEQRAKICNIDGGK